MTYKCASQIRGGACSAKEKPNFCRLGRKFLPFFRSAVVALMRVVKLTWLPKTKTTFCNLDCDLKTTFKSDQRPFDTDLWVLENFLSKRNSNPCSEGFKITVEKKWSKILMGNTFCCIQQQNLSKKDPFYPINLWINLVIKTIPIIYFLILMDISYNLFFKVCP